jgi:hypothetical protein
MLKFDKAGQLKPHQCIITDFKTVESSLLFNIHRQMLWVRYMDYYSKISQIISKDYTQWLGGGFVTEAESPKDIEVVSFIPYEFFETQEYAFKNLKGEVWEKHGIVAHFVCVYPMQHPKRAVSEADRAYWLAHFGYSNRDLYTGKRSKKGFLEIKF